jgi:hypothetical protein
MLRRLLVVVAIGIGYSMLSPALAQADTPISDGQVAAETWMTISLGTFKNSFAMFDALDAAGVHVGDLAADVLHRPAFAIGSVKRSAQLVVLSAAELGFGERASLAELYTRARKLGYELCPPEIAVQLRLQYRDQPIGDFLQIAMEPIATFNGELTGLSIANGGAGLMIVGQPISFENAPDLRTRFVFLRPQQLAQPAR